MKNQNNRPIGYYPEISEHEYKGYKAYRLCNSRPFIIISPNGDTLHMRRNNPRKYWQVSFKFICELIDNETLNEWYGNFKTEKFMPL